jgi:hypothetical protein
MLARSPQPRPFSHDQSVRNCPFILKDFHGIRLPDGFLLSIDCSSLFNPTPLVRLRTCLVDTHPRRCRHGRKLQVILINVIFTSCIVIEGSTAGDGNHKASNHLPSKLPYE